MDISCKIGTGKFNYRVAFVLLHDNKVLLTTDERFDFWSLPGGRVKMFESSAQAVQRELLEELGIKPSSERLVWVTEAMFHLSIWNSNVHELCFYYVLELRKDASIYQQNSITVDDTLVDGIKNKLTFTWFDMGALAEVNLKPEWLKKRLHALPDCSEHIVVNELG